jgi:hypothetical protein
LIIASFFSFGISGVGGDWLVRCITVKNNYRCEESISASG